MNVVGSLEITKVETKYLGSLQLFTIHIGAKKCSMLASRFGRILRSLSMVEVTA